MLLWTLRIKNYINTTHGARVREQKERLIELCNTLLIKKYTRSNVYKMTQMTKLINSSLLISLKDLKPVFLMKNFIIFGLASYTKTRRNFWPMIVSVF